ncbi:MAG: anthranilate synthase component I family protein [Bacteroidales bacterium]
MKKTKLFPKLNLLPPGVADLITPVSIYLKVRDKYPNAILLESSDYHGDKNSMTYICFDILSNFRGQNGMIDILFPDDQIVQYKIEDEHTLAGSLDEYIHSFELAEDCVNDRMKTNGLFGYTSYDAVQYFETIKFNNPVSADCKIPEVNYSLYRFILAINHFNNQLFLLENRLSESEDNYPEVMDLLRNRAVGTFSFLSKNHESSNINDDQYMDMVELGKKHCKLGDVFQIVLSRQFSQEFKGDEFNVYRSLRSINPSPYLFYFDYGGFKLFGSSPEAQLVIENGVAKINPIAGTFKRSGNDETDRQIAIDLTNDEKENAEHVMLVDLARNDLGRNSDHVKVKTYREVQYYSHVIHLVSEVTGELKDDYNPVSVFGDSFPAGTLSGAPKYKAMELIDNYENRNRGYYGGAIGYLGFDGEVNHAIMIRSFLSRNNRLFYQAGAGIVAASVKEKELEEVNNKLGALKKAIKLAEKL